MVRMTDIVIIKGQRAISQNSVTALAALLLAAACIAALAIGPRQLNPATIVQALVSFDPQVFDHQALWAFRMPRLCAALIVGAALALSGAVLQIVVSNPLAEPQILGLNAGAALAVAASITFLPPGLASMLSRPLIAAVGGALAFAAVLALSSVGRGGPTPLKLTLCGIIVSAFASSLTSAILLLDEQALDDLRVWLSGDLAGQSAGPLWSALPIFLAGVGLAFGLAPKLSALALGDAVAKGLGVDIIRTRLATLLAVALLCGSAVAIAGPIGFLGLIVPHLVRRFSGNHLRRILLNCMLVGPIVLILADMAARTIIAPEEIATGIVTGGIGATIFVIIVARYFR